MNFFNFNFNITDIVFSCKIPAGTGDVIHKNRPSHGLAFNVSGTKNYIFSSGKTITVKDNAVIFLPQGSDYAVEVESVGDCYAINFKIDKDLNFAPFAMQIKNAAEIHENFSSAAKAFTAQKSGYLFKCKEKLYAALYVLAKENDIKYMSNGTKKLIFPAAEYIHSRYTKENISVSRLAKLCGISETYFRRLFLQTYGTSPIKYINGLKLSIAKEFLSQSNYPIETVAYLSGFGDLSLFYRSFKKATGLTPAVYRAESHF